MSAFERLGLSTEKMKNEDSPFSKEQTQTQETFGFKWSLRNTYESAAVKETTRTWLKQRYLSGNNQVLNEWLSGERKIILDAGCGAAHSALLFFGDLLNDHDYLGVDISNAVQVAELRFREAGIRGEFLQCNLMDIPIPEASVDLIFSEGVLHHTDNTEKAIIALSKKLKIGGYFLFYVYAKKSPIREFTDAHIRNYLRSLSDQEAWQALESLTSLGIALGKLNTTMEVPEDIQYLGVTKGSYDLQRFFTGTSANSFFTLISLLKK